MQPTPPTKRRRSASPASPRPSKANSPARPLLPPPTPSANVPPGLYPTFVAPPSSSKNLPSHPPGWQPWASERDKEAERARPQSRRSMDARSPGSDVDSARMEGTMEGIDEGSDSGMIFSRDQTNRPPRSMMACTRCRRQKMKCDGPGQLPCRGCRAAGQPCIFEARSRPKSVSALPTRGPPFNPTLSSLGRPGSPTPLSHAGPSGSSGFYPSHSQPAPPITSRSDQAPSGSYIMRSAREPLPPAPPVSLAAMASSSYATRGHTPSASTSAIPTGPSPYYHPSQHIPQQRPLSPTELRWRNIEGNLRSLQSLPSTMGAVQASLTYLQRSNDAIYSAVTAPPQQQLRAREIIPEVSETAWNSYRASAWPLTPWLVGLRETGGLPGLVVDFLGRRTLMDRADQSRRECDEASAAVHAEVGRLVGERLEWTKEEIRSLGVYATWTNDSALACLAIGQARMQSVDRIMAPRKSHDDWREWIYLSLMDKLSHVPDFALSVTTDTLSQPWHDRLTIASSVDPAVRERDLKLLAWLEYAEYLVQILKMQQAIRLSPVNVEPVSPRVEGRPGSTRPDSGSQRGEERTEGAGKRIIEIWRKWGGRWEGWANTWSVRSDPILSLHYSYATLYTLSPVFLCSQSVWTDLASVHEGYQHLERARDAAFAVIKAICSVEISRTLPFSFALFRPLIGLALHTLISIHIALPNSPIISLSHLTSVLRSTHETIYAAHPLDAISLDSPIVMTRSPITTAGALGRSASARPASRASKIGAAPGSSGGSTSHIGPGTGANPSGVNMEGGLLREMVDNGVGRGREVWGAEPGREVWRRLVG